MKLLFIFLQEWPMYMCVCFLMVVNGTCVHHQTLITALYGLHMWVAHLLFRWQMSKSCQRTLSMFCHILLRPRNMMCQHTCKSQIYHWEELLIALCMHCWHLVQICKKQQWKNRVTECCIQENSVLLLPKRDWLSYLGSNAKRGQKVKGTQKLSDQLVLASTLLGLENADTHVSWRLAIADL